MLGVAGIVVRQHNYTVGEACFGYSEHFDVIGEQNHPSHDRHVRPKRGDHSAAFAFELAASRSLKERVRGEPADEEDVLEAAQELVALDITEAAGDVCDGRIEEGPPQASSNLSRGVQQASRH